MSREKMKYEMLERLVAYYTCLESCATRVSSRHLAEIVRKDDSQVRRDLGRIGSRGRRRAGYEADAVRGRIRSTLGLDRLNEVVIVGTNCWARSIASSHELESQGIRVAGVFDLNGEDVGACVGAMVVQPVSVLREFVRRRHVRIAILAVPCHEAQRYADELTQSGIRAIWNFSGAEITAPASVRVRTERMLAGLSWLSCHVKEESPSRNREAARTVPSVANAESIADGTSWMSDYEFAAAD